MQQLPGCRTHCYPSRHQSTLQLEKSVKGIWPIMERCEITSLIESYSLKETIPISKSNPKVYNFQMMSRNSRDFVPTSKQPEEKLLDSSRLNFF